MMPATTSPIAGGWWKWRKIAPAPRAAAMIVTSATSTCSMSGLGRDHLCPHLLHRAENLADLVVEEVADEQIGQVALVVGVSPNEGAEAESVVVRADEPPHAVHSGPELWAPLPELRLG